MPRDEQQLPRTREGGAPDASPRPPTPGVLDPEEMSGVELRFGVGPEQVVRDHMISHTLAAIASIGTDDIVFFGGTALARTYLPDLRLSEDIDLIALNDRAEISDRIEGAIRRDLRTTFGNARFLPPLRETRHPEPSVMQIGTSRIQIQLLSGIGYPAWPTEVVDIEQRYSDAPPARLRVPTAAAFVASKLSAWHDRRAPRDLYDLWALAAHRMIDADVTDLFERFGPLTNAARLSFASFPSPDEWDEALRHQGPVRVSPDEAARTVREALDQI